MKILYFAWLRSRTGMAEEDVTLPAEVGTVGELLAWLSTRSPGHAAALKDLSVIRVAVNQEFARTEDSVQGADEVALFPPVTGGR